jgi:hypothetical protein
MGRIDTVLNDSAPAFFSWFEEVIEYLPGGDAASKVSIKAIVDRSVSEGDPNIPQFEVTQFRVWIYNDVTTGRTSVDPMKDTINVAKKEGGSLQPAMIVEVLESDEGMHYFTVRL